MVKIYQPMKLQKPDTPKSISNIGKSWKDLFAYLFFALTFLQFHWLIYFYHHVVFEKGREAGLTLVGKEVALWRLTSIFRWSKAKFKYPCNYEEKTENNKLNIYWYTQYLMKSTFENIWLFFSQARHFIRLCTILHASIVLSNSAFF
jgi:hypothetical protein